MGRPGTAAGGKKTGSIQLADVLAGISRPHRFVAEAARRLCKMEPDEYGRLHWWEEWGLGICVTPTSLAWSLRLIDAMLKKVEVAGHGIKLGKDRKHRTVLIVDGAPVTIRLFERAIRRDHKPTAEERARAKTDVWYRIPQYDYDPSGELEITFEPEKGTWLERKDRKRTPLEDRVDELAAFLADAPEKARVERGHERRMEAQRAEQRRREEVQRHIHEWENQRVKELRNRASRWRECDVIRGYLAAFEREAGSRGLLHEEGEVRRWLRWAGAYADSIDPLRDFSIRFDVPEELAKLAPAWYRDDPDDEPA